MAKAIKSFLQGRFMGHPLHPIAVHLPIGLWATSLVFDILYFSGGNSSFAQFSYYLILIGLVGALLASPMGFADYIDIPKNSEAKKIASLHMILNGVIIAAYICNLYLRYRQNFSVPSTVTAAPFLLSVASVSLLSVSGYLGGLLVYEYGISVRTERPGLQNLKAELETELGTESRKKSEKRAA
jgi:uncharacterized membrane protein